MSQFFREGGFSMLFILIFGLLALSSAFFFAVRPHARFERFVAGMCATTVAATLCGTAADLSAVFHTVPQAPPDERTLELLQGLGESMAPAILGFALATLAILMFAVGKRRVDTAMV